MRGERLIAICACTALLGCGGLLRPPKLQPLEETTVFGEGGPKIVQLEIEGLISEVPRRQANPLVPRENLIGRLREALDRAGRDRKVAGLLLRIQSPGGTVSASETLYHEIRQWKERTKRPVVAHFEGLATSGAYYVAMAADEVIAHPTTVTGSIGVIFAGINVSGLMEKLGIENQTLTGGELKDAGSPLRRMRPEERAQLQSVVDNFHERFREVVDRGRPGLERAQIDPLADGRIYSAEQALDHGLVDRLGYLEDAVEAVEKRAGIDDSHVVVYHRSHEYRNNLYSSSPIGVPTISIDLFPRGLEPLAPGFYYLWPAILNAR